MDIIYALVPLSILLITIAVLVFFWAVKSGQFDDMDSPAYRILFDEDDDLPSIQEHQKEKEQRNEKQQKEQLTDQNSDKKTD